MINPNNINLTWLCLWSYDSSMGILSKEYIKNFSTNINCAIKNVLGESNETDSLITYKLNRTELEDKKEIGILFSYPDSWKLLDSFKYKGLFTGPDTDGGIAGFAENINNVDFLITPSNLSKEYCLNLGVKIPIFVVPHGINTEVFKYIESPKRYSTEFKFLYVGEVSERKNSFTLIDTFYSVVKEKLKIENEEIKLELMLVSNNAMLWYGGKEIEHKIKVINKDVGYECVKWYNNGYNQKEISGFYKDADAYIYISRCDTFGMSMLEALVTGLPVIAHDNLGISEYIKGRYEVIKNNKIPINGKHPYMLGNWLESDTKDLKEKIVDMVLNYSQYLESTKRNSDYVKQNFSWQKISKDFSNILEIIAQNVPKKKITIIVPSFNRPEYLIKTLESFVERYLFNDINQYKYNIQVVEQSNSKNQKIIKDWLSKYEYSNLINMHWMDLNLGQRGCLLYLYDKKLLNDSDYICFSDHDNIYHKPLSIYANILDEYKECFISTGYVSLEHQINDIVSTEKYGTLLRKSGCRAGHMMLRAKDVLEHLPFPMDEFWNQEFRFAWFADLDSYLTYWASFSPLKNGKSKFVYCVPGGVEHIGISSSYRPHATIEQIMECELNINKQIELNQQLTNETAKEICCFKSKI